ncbi:MAG TPA: L,D-transpeptidase [Anaerolineae bacterium]|nr:L,D-transpeptidase [Anaerolineae bacterium]HPL29398.1 L,D-transpeptidase [Anaerolineae bacterium]
MKLRWSAPCILVTLLISSFFVATVVPRLWPASPAGSAPEAAPSRSAASASGVRHSPHAAGATTADPALAPTATPLPPFTPRPTATRARTPTPTPTATPVPVLSRSIFVDQDAQMMHVYENGVEIRTIPCSTGLPVASKLTPAWVGRVGRYAGSFFSFGTYQDEGWYLFEDFLIHGAPYLWKDGIEGGTKVYQELDALGVRPVSHGCVRISPQDALWLTEWDPEGVPASISPLTRKFDP